MEEARPEEAPEVSPQLHSSVTVVETVYHQPAGDSPTVAFGDSSRWHRELRSDEQPYERRKVASGEWERLDRGWVDRAGMLVLRNDEGRFAVFPTQEQREASARRVVELSFDGDRVAILVPPGETCRFYPHDAASIWVRCPEGPARYTIHLVPE